MNTNTLPKDFLSRMQAMLGEDYDNFIESYQKPETQALRINTLKAEPAAVLSAEILTRDERTGARYELRPVPWCREGVYYPSEMRPGKHLYHEAGAYYIQEPSAMSPATFLAPKPGERILDLCAAPGGKSTQIAALLQGQGLLVSNEIHPARAKILSENIERMGIRNAVVTNESPAVLASRFPLFFDRILVDAPCSGEGMFRKNEEAILQWSEENVRLCAARQDEILREADKMLRPGGRLVFSTCTFAPAENEGSIGRFLAAHPDYSLLDMPLSPGMSHGILCKPEGSLCPAFSDARFAQRVADRVIRLMPHRLEGEGHFIAVLQKEAAGCPPLSAPAGNKIMRERTGGKKKQESDIYTLLNTFLQATLLLPLTGDVLPFGDQLYLLPEGMPSIAGLKVVRPGLHLGTRKKDRFEPSHALALTLSARDVRAALQLSSADREDYRKACRFVEGQTFPHDGEKGWYLITLDGLSIGWGRLAGGIMKNYYPKGLRKQLC